ncbi:MAG: DUF5677 domain-containing protein [Thermodesulfobacteriota bacterium]|jgi:hypothetical protein
MDEFYNILKKYDEGYISGKLETLDKLIPFAGAFYKDAAEIYDCITRVKNISRNPTGFSLNDAPILGLLVRIWKLLKEIIRYYEEDNAEIIGVLERPLIEASITATYLMINTDEVLEDYRKCSYKDRLRILKESKGNSTFFQSKPGVRLLKSVEEKMRLEGFSQDSFAEQKRNRWKLQGKSFFEIFVEVEHEDMYKYTYGMMSESVHCSWNESMDFCLQKNDDGTFSAFPFYQPADIRYVTPTLRLCNQPYRLWLKRIDVEDEYLLSVLDWIERVNARLFKAFDVLYDEKG